ncbi:hypothetical protein D2V08_03285 [Flagellimonas lutimaris]|uniref:Uncharacterized protein n=1 Tax=Flagellimonas lutimaris TaxID=475082 RepID=A0A3A1N9W6_9FLAO|nr:hypothetical protein D2V08_03285 [Allomuricauda lutimaris]
MWAVKGFFTITSKRKINYNPPHTDLLPIPEVKVHSLWSYPILENQGTISLWGYNISIKWNWVKDNSIKMYLPSLEKIQNQISDNS